ncbi:metal-binding protein [Pseudomonas sp. Fl4BN1]|uniref:metal-binding protein n=1 Tax=Pseudomonas sp. Fl4BN1 TaxID=2697651 RepID=UPI001378398A|nr:metal-binding protein [Pseudomonas sp. Fl4BN1]NBF13155.1 metal-binding protein [Pseudomonas sp. Fl4BN1]
MGEYAKQITKRIRHVGLKEGFCLICGIYGKLSQDHVPPSSCVTIQRVEQRLVTEMLGPEAKKFAGIKARNGSSFRTICEECNNKLGRCDGVVSEAYKKLTKHALSYYRSIDSFGVLASAPINPIVYARSLIGHMLAATSDQECLRAPEHSEYYDPLKRFVLGDDSALDETHDIYYWYYPKNIHISAKSVIVRNRGHQTTVSVLSFFPVAFMVTLKGQGIYPAQAVKLSFSDKSLIINLSSTNLPFVDFPFVPLSGDQFYMLYDAQAIVSYPTGR